MGQKKGLQIGMIFLVLFSFFGSGFIFYSIITKIGENYDPSQIDPEGNIHNILPKPKGTYDIGCIKFALTDTSRYEYFTNDPDDYRTLLIRAWYPADSNQTLELNPIVYQEPAFYFKELSNIPTNSYPNIPISSLKAKFPVIIFSHGYGSYEGLYQILMQELASSGYIVISINHPFEAAFTFFSSFSFIKMNMELPTLGQEGTVLMDILTSVTRTLEEKKSALAFLEKSEFWSNQLKDSLDLWTIDSQFVINFLEQINSEEDSKTSNLFYQRLDLENIGIMGHSFGGATAGEISLIDNRIKAGINMDGIEIGQALHTNLTIPFMFMYSKDKALMNDVLFLQAENDAYSLTTKRSEHMNYCDSNLVISYFKEIGHDIGPLGSIDEHLMLEIMNVYTVAFFNKYLKNLESPLLNNSSTEYPEVDLHTRNLI